MRQETVNSVESLIQEMVTWLIKDQTLDFTTEKDKEGVSWWVELEFKERLEMALQEANLAKKEPQESH